MKKAQPTHPMTENISTVVEMEERFLLDRNRVERIGDAIAAFVGSMSFVVLHLVAFGLWFLVNAKVIPGLPAFDPYPFTLLNMAVSLEAVLLSTFVLMKQNREGKRAEQRQHLTLQIDLLAEREATKSLQLLQAICRHLGIESVGADHETRILSETTAVAELAEELRNKLPPGA